jgi:hypothetical protein
VDVNLETQELMVSRLITNISMNIATTMIITIIMNMTPITTVKALPMHTRQV